MVANDDQPAGLGASAEARPGSSSQDFLTVIIAGQMFGIPVLQVQDILGRQSVTKVPLAPAEVDGSLNLRGRIVTAINVRKRLNLPPDPENSKEMSVVIEHDGELYSLVIDNVGDVLSLQDNSFEKTPPTLDPLWKSISCGVYQLEGTLLVVMNVPELLGGVHSKEA